MDQSMAIASNGPGRNPQRTYFISPLGSDANNGTSLKAPWKTFAFAVPRLKPGDTLLLADGTYSDAAGTGYPNINCSAKASNGTPTAPITIAAQHERQAFIQGDGRQEAFLLNNCSYWSIVGLHVESADFNVGNTYTGDVMAFVHDSNLNIRRNLAARPNRYGNVHVLLLWGTTNSLVEENEVYFYHRGGIELFGESNNNEVRRNYVNSRNTPNIPGGYPSGDRTMGDHGVTSYTSNGNIFENNVAEDVATGFNVENTASNNAWLGNIAHATKYGFRIGPHTGMSQPVDNVFTNNVSLNALYIGFWNRGGKATYDHNSAFGTSTALAGFRSDTDICCTFASYVHIVTNSVAQDFSGSGIGYQVMNTTNNTFRYDHDNSFNNGTNYSPSKNVTNATNSNAALGGCYLWVPVASPIKKAGDRGQDIGANILYRYEKGQLTRDALWDHATGEFPHGAMVRGLNDLAGSSAFDVHKRLKVGPSGCSFPEGY